MRLHPLFHPVPPHHIPHPIYSLVCRCDEVILLSDKSDSIPYVIKANVMMQKALMEMQMAQMQQSQQLLAAAQNTMREVEGIFNEAIAIEPNGMFVAV